MVLVTFEVGRALGEESLDALARVVGLERLNEGAKLDLDGLVDGRLQAVVHGLDDQPCGDGRPLAQLAAERLGVGERLALLREPVDEADAVAFGGGDPRCLKLPARVGCDSLPKAGLLQ